MQVKKVLRTSLLTLGLLGILNSNIYAGETEQTDFIERFYQNIMGRTADSGGMTTWLNTIQNESATKVALGFFKSQEFINKNLTNEQFVDILYQTLFDRQGDTDGRNNWINQLNSGTSQDVVMYGFFNAQEFKNLADRFGVTAIRAEDQLNTGTTGVNGYVNRFYTLVLNRNADTSGFNDWTTQLNSGTKAGGDIAKGFFNSQEYLNRGLDNSTFLDICYKAFFDREADSGGKSDWTTKLSQGYTKDQILDGFIDSQEFINLANNYGIKNKIAASAIVSSIKGKKITLYDAEGTAVGKFYENGNYAETWSSGGASESCSGRWKDLGSNKIGTTCDNYGTTSEPDGNIVNEDETHLQFKSDTLTVGDSVTIIDNETFDVNVRSIEDILISSLPTNLRWIKSIEISRYFPTTSSTETVNDINGLVKYYTTFNPSNSTYLSNGSGGAIALSENGIVVSYTPSTSTRGTTSLGDWGVLNDVIVIKLSRKTIYLKLVNENGINYLYHSSN